VKQQGIVGTWDEQQAQDGLITLNGKVASIFAQQPKEVSFVFVPLIDRRQILDKEGDITVRETVGTCDHENLVIRIVVNRRWAKTAVHELVHLYNPRRSEKKISSLTEEVIKYLRQGELALR